MTAGVVKKSWRLKMGLVVLCFTLLGAGCKKNGVVDENITNKNLNHENVAKALQEIKSEFNWDYYDGDASSQAGDWIARRYSTTSDKTYHEYIMVKHFPEYTSGSPSWEAYDNVKNSDMTSEKATKFDVGFEADAICLKGDTIRLYSQDRWSVESSFDGEEDCSTALENLKVFWEKL